MEEKIQEEAGMQGGTEAEKREDREGKSAGYSTENSAEAEDRALIRQALEARKSAYTPYSHFKVGAALLTEDGRIYKGCNIENASYGAANCAERTAFFKAVSEGAATFRKIAIVGGPEGVEQLSLCEPCGICRQVMAEFCEMESFQVILAGSETEYRSFLLKELLPYAFLPSQLEKH